MLRLFAVHVTEEHKHLHVWKTSTPPVRWPSHSPPFFPESKRGNTSNQWSFPGSHDGEAEGDGRHHGPSALRVPGVSLNRFHKMKTEVERSSALLRSRSPHPAGQRVPAPPQPGPACPIENLGAVCHLELLLPGEAWGRGDLCPQRNSFSLAFTHTQLCFFVLNKKLANIIWNIIFYYGKTTWHLPF